MSRASIPASSLEAFLDALSTGATVGEACAAAHIGRSTACGYRRRNRDFAARRDETLRQGRDALEDELHARAMDRADPDSPRLLIFLLARRRPEIYGRVLEVDVRVETTGSADEFRALLALSGIPFARQGDT